MEKMMTVMTLVILFTYKLRQRQAGPTHGRKLPDLLHSMVFDHLNYNLQSHKLVQLATQLTQHRGFPRQIPPWSPHFLQPVGPPLITNIGNLMEIFVKIWQTFAIWWWYMWIFGKYLQISSSSEAPVLFSGCIWSRIQSLCEATLLQLPSPLVSFVWQLYPSPWGIGGL